MKIPAVPSDEMQRLKTLREYGLLDTPPEQALDDLTALAAQICEVPIALVSLVDAHRQWFKSKLGLTVCESPRDISFCGHAILEPKLFIIPDATLDERFADNPLVTGEQKFRFYAGAPLITPDGQALGTLCVIDREPRQLSPLQQEALKVLSRQAMAQLELRRQTRELAQSERFLRTVFDSEPESVMVLGPDGSLQMMNRAGLAMIEADSFGAVAGYCVYQLVAPEQRAKLEALTQRIFRGESNTLEFQINGLKGAKRWLETHAAPLRDEHGQVTALLGITRDITEHKRAEKRQAAFTTLGRRLNVANDEVTAARIIVGIAEELFGWDSCKLDRYDAPTDQCYSILTMDVINGQRQEVPPLQDGTSPSPRLRKLLQGQPELVLRAEPLVATPDRIPFGDVNRPSASIMAVPLREGGTVIGALSIHSYRLHAYTQVDLAELQALADHCAGALERIRGRAEVERQRAELELILDTFPGIIFYKDRKHRLVRVNEAHARSIGLPRSAVEGRTDAELGSPYEERYIRDDDEVMRTGQPKLGIIELQHTPNGTRWLQTDKLPYRDEHGNIIGVLGFALDITERKRTEEKLALQSETLVTIAESLAAYVERGDWREATGHLLRCALSQTQSEYGFVGVVVGTTLRVLAHEGIVWDKIINRGFYEQALRTYQEKGYLEFTNFNNLFGQAITTGQVVIANMPDSDPRSGGRPTGHPAMRSFLGVPILAGQEVQGMIALANRPGGYSVEEQHRIETLLQHAGGLCTSYRQHETTLVLEQERRAGEDRFIRQRNAVITLMQSEALYTDELTVAQNRITETAARTLDVARVSIWLYPRDGAAIQCVDLYELAANRHSNGTELSAVAFPAYFRALREMEVIAADDAQHDPRTCEFTESYLAPLGITSMMDASIYVGGELAGVLCHEHIGPPRQWAADEKSFAVTIANLVSLALEGAERRRAQAEARKSQDRFTLVARATNDAVWDWNLESNAVWWNENFQSLFGYQPEEIEPGVESWVVRLHPEDKERVLAGIHGVIDHGGQSWSGEYRFRRRDGTYAAIFDRGYIIHDAGGKPVRMIGAMQDITERKQADTALRESEANRQLAFEAAQLGDWNWDIVGGEVQWSARCKALYGLSPDTAMNYERFLQLVHPEDRDRIDSALHQAVELRSDYEVEKRIIWPDGSLHWTATRGRVFSDAAGNPTRLAGVTFDITERKQAEAALRDSAVRFHTVWESAVDAMRLLDENGVIVAVNAAFCKLVGMRREELEGQPFTVTYAGDRTPLELQQQFQIRFRERRIPAHEERRMTFRAGHTAELEITSTFVELPGHPALLFGLFRDVTERKRAEQDLRESRRLLEKAQEVGHVGSWISDSGLTRKLTWSAETCRIFGLAPEKFGGNVDAFLSLVHPEDRKAIEEASLAALAGERHYNLEHRIIRPDGSLRWVHEQADVERNSAGQPVRMVGVVQDITERRELEEQFRQSQKMDAIGQLAGGVAHDFNNILAAMMMQTELLSLTDDLSLEVQNGLQDIQASAERAANLTRQLLLFSRKQVMHTRELDLNEAVTSLFKMLQRIIGEHLNLQFNLCPRSLNVHADPGMLDQVLMNLVVNARDAMPEGGRITIATSEKTLTKAAAAALPETSAGRYACMQVTDTGCGIPPENLTRIFEPFFTTKDPGKGTGLGLATVFGIVKQHGGTVIVESEVGRGTSFQILFPIAHLVEKPAEKATAKVRPRGGTETILLVEDDSSVRMLTRIVLERAGYRIVEASNGVEAVELWAEHKDSIRLLLTDIVMPEGVSGRELATRLQAQNPKLRVVFTSGYSADIAGRELALQEGQNFIQKPAPPHKLLETVRQSLDAVRP